MFDPDSSRDVFSRCSSSVGGPLFLFLESVLPPIFSRTAPSSMNSFMTLEVKGTEELIV